MTTPRQMPHCDELVLHAPGECSYCDDYASDLQADRVVQGINFTGHSDPDKEQCPAEARRPYDVINLWGGNRAATRSPAILGYFVGLD